MEDSTPSPVGTVLERTRAGTEVRAEGEGQGVMEASEGTGEEAPARAGVGILRFLTGEGEALEGLSALAFLRALGVEEEGVGALRFFLESSEESSALIGEEVLTVSCGLVVVLLSEMNFSKQPQSSIFCSAARLVRQR